MRPALTSDTYILIVYIMNLPYSILQYPSSIHQNLVTSVPFFPYPQPNPPYPITKTTTLCKFVQKKTCHIFLQAIWAIFSPTTLLPVNLQITHGPITLTYWDDVILQVEDPTQGFCYIPGGGFLRISSTINRYQLTHHPSTQPSNHHLQNRRDHPPSCTQPIIHITQPSNHPPITQPSNHLTHLTIHHLFPRLRAALGLSSGPADYKLMAGRQGCTLVKVTWTAVEQAGQRGSGDSEVAGRMVVDVGWWMCFFGREMWVFPKIGVPQNGWFIMENLFKMDDLDVGWWMCFFLGGKYPQFTPQNDHF